MDALTYVIEEKDEQIGSTYQCCQDATMTSTAAAARRQASSAGEQLPSALAQT